MTIEPGLESLLAKYPVVIALPVFWGDQDAFGHVNNNAYFRWFESARIAYSQRIGLLDLFRPSGSGRSWRRSPATTVASSPFPIRSTSAFASRGSAAPAWAWSTRSSARASQPSRPRERSTIVVFDYRANKPHPIPPLIRQAIDDVEGRTFE